MMMVVERAIHTSFCYKYKHLLLFTVSVLMVLMPSKQLRWCIKGKIIGVVRGDITVVAESQEQIIPLSAVKIRTCSYLQWLFQWF
jgi:hypothetical protein